MIHNYVVKSVSALTSIPFETSNWALKHRRHQLANKAPLQLKIPNWPHVNAHSLSSLHADVGHCAELTNRCIICTTIIDNDYLIKMCPVARMNPNIRQ